MKSFFAKLLQPRDDRRFVAALYGAVMAGARDPRFFTEFGLPNSFETRFELLALHMFLVLDRLKAEGKMGKPLMQALTEYMVDDLDRTLREAGIGDVGVSKRMKKLMSGFYGRVVTYDKALGLPDEKEILRALDRNLFGAVDTDVKKLEAMRTYIVSQREKLKSKTMAEVEAGQIAFAAALS